MLRIGLTGGIGAGKSTVAQLFAQRGVPVIDSDVLAREVVAPGSPVLDVLVQRFGAEVVTAAGELDRGALAARAFASAEDTRALGQIMHPAIQARADAHYARYADERIVVHDVPLLVENGLSYRYHLVLGIDVPADIRLQRLVQLRGMTSAEAQARIDQQATDAQRRAACDVLLDNTKSREGLRAAFDNIFAARIGPYAQNLAKNRAAQDATPPADAPGSAVRLLARVRAALTDLKSDTAVVSCADGAPIELSVTGGADSTAAQMQPALASAGFFPERHAVGTRVVSADPGCAAWVGLRPGRR